MKRYVNPYRQSLGAFIPNWLMVREEVSNGAKIVYARLGQFASTETGVAWPAIETLVKATATKERTLHRLLDELEGHGLIERRRRGFGHSNTYSFLWHPWMTSDVSAAVVEKQHEDLRLADQELSKVADQELPPLAVVELTPTAGNKIKRKDKTQNPSSTKKSSSLPATPVSDVSAFAGGKATPSSVEEVKAYAEERLIPKVEGEKFWDYFSACGWRVTAKKVPMKDWKAAFRTWERNFISRGGMYEGIPDDIPRISVKDFCDQQDALYGKAKPVAPIDKDAIAAIFGGGDLRIG